MKNVHSQSPSTHRARFGQDPADIPQDAEHEQDAVHKIKNVRKMLCKKLGFVPIIGKEIF